MKLLTCTQTNQGTSYKDGVFVNPPGKTLCCFLSDPSFKGIFFAASSGIAAAYSGFHFGKAAIISKLCFLAKPLSALVPALAPIGGTISMTVVSLAICSLWVSLFRNLLRGRNLLYTLNPFCKYKWPQNPFLLQSKFAIVTGGNSGIGYETALQLCRWGATVVIGCRRPEEGEKAARKIQTIVEEEMNPLMSGVKCGKVTYFNLDLSSFSSVRKFVEEVKNVTNRVDLLVNNAGIMMLQKCEESNGFEKQFATNHLGHFLLTNLLLNEVKSCDGRVINVSSCGHSLARYDFLPHDVAATDETRKLCIKYAKEFKYEWEESKHRPIADVYDDKVCYGNSKMANVWFTHELQRRFNASPDTNATAFCLHPGMIITNLYQHAHSQKILEFVNTFIFNMFAKDTAGGARTTLFLCSAPLNALHPGGYYVDCDVGVMRKDGFDEKLEKLLWTVSEHVVGLAK